MRRTRLPMIDSPAARAAFPRLVRRAHVELGRVGASGPALKPLTRGWPMERAEIPVVDLDACNGCSVCETSCVYGAIHVVDGRIALDGERCSRCGLCVTRCRRDALTWPTPA